MYLVFIHHVRTGIFNNLSIYNPVFIFFVTPGLKSEDPVGRAAFKVALWKTYWRYRVEGTEEQVSESICAQSFHVYNMHMYKQEKLLGMSKEFWFHVTLHAKHASKHEV